MAGGGEGSRSSSVSRVRKRVEANENGEATTTANSSSTSLKRAKDGSAFIRCECCGRSVPAVLISMHDCSLDKTIKENLEAQIVETVKEVKRKAPEKTLSRNKGQKGKTAKDPNKPKRPATAFFVFMEEFRKTFKEEHPDNKSVATVAKEGGEKWKSLTDVEKKPYQVRAAELKAEYEKVLEEAQKADNEDEGALLID
ncbi:hypothetical protein RJ639_018818 [Escallonia herrerae]|uniref:HMG box domain-containing protein n=1 Tax=Escallonia herrerae TaxID=1293975 RepID=A0AA88V7W2_9ASTE|nr:hypothetical protein RJ639_025173 [Escallonia herrerae]KAK3003487.1 hypothetical protein RJ639_018818 [Escallonia herrerae]